MIFIRDQVDHFLASLNFSLPEELLASLALELWEENEVLELEGGNQETTFDGKDIEETSIKEKLSQSLLMFFSFWSALIGVTTVILR